MNRRADAETPAGKSSRRQVLGVHRKTQNLIDTAYDVLAEFRPMTVRQVFYQLVSRQVIKNTRSRYQALSNALVRARKDGEIPWEWIEDRLRRPRHVQMRDSTAEYADVVKRAYRRSVWLSQQVYVECWLEKDALSGIFEDILDRYGVTLCVGRGYDGWDSIHKASERYGTGEDVSVFYFGDFDPSGEDMVRSLQKRLGFFGCHPAILKCALTKDDIDRYDLPPAMTKTTDSRRARFVAEHGDISVELDALPPGVLQARIRDEVERQMDMDALRAVWDLEADERDRIEEVLRAL